MKTSVKHSINIIIIITLFSFIIFTTTFITNVYIGYIPILISSLLTKYLFDKYRLKLGLEKKISYIFILLSILLLFFYSSFKSVYISTTYFGSKNLTIIEKLNFITTYKQNTVNFKRLNNKLSEIKKDYPIVYTQDNLIIYSKNQSFSDNSTDITNIITEINPKLTKLFDFDSTKEKYIIIDEGLSSIDEQGRVKGGFVDDYSIIYLTSRQKSSELGYENSSRNNTYNSAVAHEYTHSIVTDILHVSNKDFSSIPIWFHEGLSSYVEFSIMNVDNSSIINTSNISIKDVLNSNTHSIKGSESIYYESCNKLVKAIYDDIGKNGVMKLLTNNSNKNFEQMLSDISGKSIYEYQYALN